LLNPYYPPFSSVIFDLVIAMNWDSVIASFMFMKRIVNLFNIQDFFQSENGNGEHLFDEDYWI